MGVDYARPGTIVAGYYPSWLKAEFPAENINVDNLTHVLHSFVRPESDGSLNYDSGFIYPQLNSFVSAAGKKIMVALGGWGGSDGFPAMAVNSQSRDNFVNNITKFCIEHNYDGIDIDWEHPANAEDRENLVTLVKDIRQAFNESGKDLLITMAVTAGSWNGQWIDYPSLIDYIDWFGCMTYDFHGSWTTHAGHNSPLYSSSKDFCGSVNDGLIYLNLTRKVPKEKILIGIPFYGKEFNASRLYGPSTGGDVTFKYNEIIPLINNGWTYYWDNISMVPYLIKNDSTKLITFDDTLSVRLKCNYALEKEIAGVMIWALGFDVVGSRQLLLETIGQYSLGIFDTLKNVTSYTLQQNYPNPFNGYTTISYNILHETHVKLDIIDLNGRVVSKLVDLFQPPQHYSIRFNANNLPSGIYFFRLTTPIYTKTGKMALIK
ncbi:T9SS type A sorting domain-containing protein [candidate division KSB1 bacterium]|nr:T9SS type A sorting domain-containing protein [candidate division KSB1 bacterium]